MKSHFAVLLFFLSLTAAIGHRSAADILVVPNENEATPGFGAQIPFDGEGGRYQTIFGANQFGNVPTEGIIINEIAFRIDETDRNAYEGSIQDVEVRMSTTPSLRPVVNTAWFNENVGADYRPVFRGKVDYSIARSAEAVNPFSLRIIPQEPFGYNPSQGSLLVDLLVHEGSSGPLYIDAGTPSEHVIGLVGNTVNPVGLFQVPLILQLDFTAIPEPSALFLLIAFGGGSLLRRRSLFVNLPRWSLGLAIAFALTVGRQSWADTLVLPNGHETTPGAGGQVPYSGDGNRSQNIYAASHFENVTSEGILVNAVAFRINESDPPAVQGLIGDVEIRLGTTPSLRPILTLNLNENIGQDYRTVFRGTVEYSIPQSPENVNPFSLYVRLQEPFLYDPKKGSFLIDILTHSGATTALLLDAGIGPDNTTLAIDGNTIQPTGTFQVPLVMQLGFVGVPEPTVGALAILGWVGWMFARKGRT